MTPDARFCSGRSNETRPKRATVPPDRSKPRYATCNGRICAISFFSPRAASHRSTLRWRFNQNSGELPNNLPSRSAISGVTARRDRESVVRQKVLAEDLARVNRPTFTWTRVGNTHGKPLRLVIVAELDVIGIAILEAKANAPLIVDTDRVLTRTIALECVQPISRWYAKIRKHRGRVNRLQSSKRPPRHIGGDSLRSAGAEERFGRGISK